MVRHFLADGREVESIEGMIVPPTGETAAVYRIVAEILKKNPKKKQQSKEEGTNATA